MKAVIKLDVPDWQVGQPVTVYFKDTMIKRGVCEFDIKGYGLKPCPFCGRDDTLDYSTAKGNEECKHFEDEACPMFEESDGCPYQMIVCACGKGGCGASSGWKQTLEETIKAWTRRGGEDA